MVARSPPKQPRKMVVAMVAPPPLSPTLLRETVKKVDKCMARLQELQCTVTGGRKMRLSPRRTQDALRLKTANSRKSSSPGKLPINTEDWKRMSLPAMLLGETMGEILQASQFARNAVEAVSKTIKPPVVVDDPKTPITQRTRQKLSIEDHSGMRTRRKREKLTLKQQEASPSTRCSESSDVQQPQPSLRRAKSKINFKVSSPVNIRQCDKENCRYIANRVSPRNRPWVNKTVLFPNPLFHPSPNAQHQKFGKTKSPMIVRNRQTPYKFVVKSPPKIRSPPLAILPKRSPRKVPSPSLYKFVVKSPPKIRSPPRLAILPKKSPRKAPSPSFSSMAKLRRSFSPSRLANRLMSPLKSRRLSVQKNEDVKFMSGLKQRPMSFSARVSPRRI